MRRGVVRYLLFLLAYIPIYIIAALKTINKDCFPIGNKSLREIASLNAIPVSLVVLSVLLVIYFKIYSKLALRPKGNPIFTISKISPQHKEYVTYLGTYILPFVALETKSVFDVIAIVFMFLTIGFIFSKTNLIYTI